ncbi:hypothetical protein [Persicitalea jodogahamensis]|uniref:Lipoprotein n=1 Tax=Persicitalea jodogahamensis TaxID=402147 RepID=A0A8J3D2M5_9BACT|nr:hypothetical protein [Persicitalea jodogahamensis]GHB70970.1 hypothetical protein GCM10007390_25890 [Persicitalea jodogahamensis]
MKYKVLLFVSLLLTACHRPADDVWEAKARLLAVDRWQLEQIAMDEVPVFKDGKHIPHLSGARFDRHMDWVSFKSDGSFEGHFVGDDTTQHYQWKVYVPTKVIALRDSATGTGGWNIYPRNVYEDAFEMETRSTIYDPPRVTKLTLRYSVLRSE